jgi:fatty acid desaturase
MEAMPTMVPATLPSGRDTVEVRADGKPQPAFREELRRIPTWRNALSVVGLYLQTAALIWLSVRWMWLIPITFILMGRAFAQFASLMHEAAHRLLFANKRANDWVGRWLLGYPAFTSTDAYRRVHMAHHRDEFGPDEPDIPLYEGYPIGKASFRRKMVRDATGQTGLKLMRQLLANLRSKDARSRRTVWKIVAVQALLLAGAIVWGHWWLYPLLWLAPYLTVWRVTNRLRSIAEHGGMQRSKDRRETTHSVRQHVVARFLLVPYNIGWHLAHHVDSGIPFRHLPAFHQALADAGYVDDSFEYRSYPAICKALAS